MKLLKKVFFFIFIAGIFISITSCSNNSSQADSNSTTARAIPPLCVVPLCPGDVSTWSATCLEDAYKNVQSAGIGITQQYIEWGDIEKKQGTFYWSDFDGRITLHKQLNLKNSVVIGFPNNMLVGSLPGDVAFVTFADPVLNDRFIKFILAMLERSKGEIDYLWIGNEIDAYLKNNRSQIVPFGEMYKALRLAVKGKFPSVSIGTISTYHDALNNNALDIIEKVGIHGDIIGFSLYPQMAVKATPKDAAGLIGDISKIADRMGKKFAITESGWSTNPLGMNGSEPGQTEFIMSLLDGAAAHVGSIEFLGLFVLYDMPDSITQTILKRYGIGDNKEFFAMVSSLGLIANNGTEKSAWKALINKIR